MNNRRSHPRDNGQPLLKSDHFSAKLAVIAGAFNILGDFLGTLSSTIALEEIAEEERQNQLDSKLQEERFASMQKQIDELTLQLNRLKKP
ncbi:hypothetical protein [Paenibacillus sacheonensis]|uniref:Translation initiation factor 2 n=1 Tax=Paenibacillus sacheonensis TaxID=742054 RepID=A0A7X4YRS6_9BACL|nr:hypothetical protein [Paenibacillus sacheonensis]MBM7567564.1 hypothetical protein [Paenibacillus sacheonensis]NBC71333.1 hypothetical protein [Paenibacillus sacheonensis]